MLDRMDSEIELEVRCDVDDRELSELHARAFGSDFAQVEPWADRLARHSLSWVGAFHADQLVGFVHACWDGGRHAFLLDTVVEPTFQHRCIGRALVRRLTAEVAAAGCDWLHVDYEPHLDNFYRSCGFDPTAAGLLQLSGSGAPPSSVPPDRRTRPGT